MSYEINDPVIMKQFTELIRKLTRDEIKNIRADRHVWAKVVNVGLNSADVILANSLNSPNPIIIPDIPNYSGQTLIPGDEVYLLCINGNLSNSVIHLRKRL